jgi:hypothetical protein
MNHAGLLLNQIATGMVVYLRVWRDRSLSHFEIPEC